MDSNQTVPIRPTIRFIRVRNNQEKLRIILETVEQQFHQNERIQITVADEKALKFLDDALWSFREESFIPHHVSSHESSEIVILTLMNHKNLNQATVQWNLSGHPSPIATQFQVTIELFDETDPQKKKDSKTRMEEYQKRTCIIEQV